jgi:hypothetical protein
MRQQDNTGGCIVVVVGVVAVAVAVVSKGKKRVIIKKTQNLAQMPISNFAS